MGLLSIVYTVMGGIEAVIWTDVIQVVVLLGGAILVLCDAAARTLIQGAEMPVGIVTALVGGPIFIRILMRSGR